MTRRSSSPSRDGEGHLALCELVRTGREVSSSGWRRNGGGTRTERLVELLPGVRRTDHLRDGRGVLAGRLRTGRRRATGGDEDGCQGNQDDESQAVHVPIVRLSRSGTFSGGFRSVASEPRGL